MATTTYIDVYLFDSEQQAQDAIETINAGEGIPVSPEATTRTYTVYEQYGDYWYIYADDVTRKYLGDPVRIEIEEQV
jgi:hypothetical protein